MEQQYDKSFYEENSPYATNSSKKIVPYLSKLFPHITTVVDIGCGLGEFLNEWKNEGKNVLGIDGNDLSDTDRKINRNEYIKHDISISFPPQKNKYDLCMCLEVAEHLPEERAVSFISDLCSYSDIVIFSAAIPGQTGTNHINEQWPQYWADKFYANNYKSYDILRSYFWNDSEVGWWYSQNMILYMKSPPPPLLINNNYNFNEKILSFIHPKCLEMYLNNKPVSIERFSYKQRIKNKIKRILRCRYFLKIILILTLFKIMVKILL